MLETPISAPVSPGPGAIFPPDSPAFPAQAAANIARLLPGHPLVGITAWGLDGFEVVGWSCRDAATLEQAQGDYPDSPGADVVRTHRRVLIADLTDEERWRDYCAHLHALGVRSLYCHPLIADDQVLGLLGLYSHRRNAFHPKGHDVAARLG
ncbi:GAF domain-containing protein [Nocardia puris]|uniref:GAF domain-containing protein n=1 Tax=Nocardia puris TaxID=208602 RepID=UPI0018957CF1|nr:GAF domain-containing protein [Nocardia puris]MBF6214073.1 GAF domain-containing protein [Nocardia puris]MBF6368643.1 GAF domain-containing protein [Nocardia puris]MBF6461545.1 GAF domain-containing protein [Nocardia puris]